MFEILGHLSYIVNICPCQAKKCLWTCAKCAASDHSAHAPSIIQAFVLHSYILQYPRILLADREGLDQTVHQRSLIWAFGVHTWPEGTFSLVGAQLYMITLPSYKLSGKVRERSADLQHNTSKPEMWRFHKNQVFQHIVAWNREAFQLQDYSAALYKCHKNFK